MSIVGDDEGVLSWVNESLMHADLWSGVGGWHSWEGLLLQMRIVILLLNLLPDTISDLSTNLFGLVVGDLWVERRVLDCHDEFSSLVTEEDSWVFRVLFQKN